MIDFADCAHVYPPPIGTDLIAKDARRGLSWLISVRSGSEQETTNHSAMVFSAFAGGSWQKDYERNGFAVEPRSFVDFLNWVFYQGHGSMQCTEFDVKTRTSENTCS